MTPSDPSANRPDNGSVPLSRLERGACGRVLQRLGTEDDRELLAAMGLAAGRELRVCRTGEPVIVQVGSTRLGLPASVAARVLVRRG